MCGIAGTIRFRGKVDADLLAVQRDTMVHRGPDSSGIWCSPDGRVGFAHRRLAIIDLTPAGHQPMIDRETGSVLTFNGEIYNYLQLRDRLAGLGHRFHTHSDTEVILAAYREWGVQCVEELDGMFAFALYDEASQRVLLARDRAGEKPLFFRASAEQFVFASEAKALLADPACPRRVRAQSLNEFLAYGYVTGEHTMFADIKRLLPGGRAVVDLSTGAVKLDRYWVLPSLSGDEPVRSPDELVDELHELLKQSVRRQLVADVPVGVLLSGGVDSSLITAVAAGVSDRPVRTFTARFPNNPGFDEGPFARLVAQHLGTEHVELEAQPADADLLMRLVAQFDEPVADSSMIPTFLVSQEIRKHATVALGGDGGDELFGGYFRYPVQLRHDRLRRRVPAFARAAAAGAAAHLLPEGVPGRGFLSALSRDVGASIANAGRIFRDDERAALSASVARLSAADLQAPELIRQCAMSDRASLVQRATAVDFSTYMVDDVLVKVDRASMLTSLEVRAPFLDRAVMEFAFSRLPDSLRATEQDRKVILRRLGERLLPKALDLKRKQGFSIPVDDWMRGPWRSLLEDAAGQNDGGSIVSSVALQSYRAMLDKGRPVGGRLFSLLVLKLWQRQYGITDAI
jgi:asparagine synthase (glutamine-hydrolysing)